MHALRRVARAIHRRSVWQVVAIHAAVGWFVLTGVGRLTEWAGLPSWTPFLTLVLILALLPLVVATAVVQNGIPGLRIEDWGDPNELPGLSPSEVHVLRRPHRLLGLAGLTWRNTLLCGVAAVVLLIASVVAYLSAWALGVGSVGSLLAQGVIRPGDPVRVATFSDRTDQGSLGVLVSDAIELDLMQSDIVSVVVANGFPVPDAALVVAGDVASGPAGYVLSARIMRLPEGTSLALYTEVAPGEGDLLDTIELLSERVREKLGESLRSVRRGPRLERLRTDSEESQELFGLATAAAREGDHTAAAEWLGESLAVDEGFALAWRALGAAEERMADTARALDAYRRAIELWPSGVGGQRTPDELRERISALER